MRSPAVIRGALQAYDWGVVDGLAAWSGLRTGEPQAELWYGSHPAAPSPLDADPAMTLRDAWREEPAPLLTKILAAASPLSLQVHPTQATIRSWAQDPSSLALLPDRAEKIEMLIALEPFATLLGWRPLPDAERFLRLAGAHTTVLSALGDGDRKLAVRLLLQERPIRAEPSVWVSATRDAELDEMAVPAMTAITRRFAGDPGVAVAALLQSELLLPGDAAFVPAGVPHAYIHGLGLEVMNASDNVLRLGLTHKTMAVPQALAALDDDRGPLVIRRPDDQEYSPPGAPFAVSWAGEAARLGRSGRYRLALALDGACRVAIGSAAIDLPQGLAVAIPEEASGVEVTSGGRAALVEARTQ